MAPLGPITLRGRHIRLEPMRPVHAAALLEAGRAREIWDWMPTRPLASDAIDRWLEKAIQAEAQGRE
jgi:N-acetyltransferase